MLATILTSCGLMMLSSCSNEDNTDTPPTDEVEAQLRGKDGADEAMVKAFAQTQCTSLLLIITMILLIHTLT